MKQTKKQIEEYWQNEYWSAITRYKKKLMFWQPLGVIALIGIGILFLYVLVQAFPNTFPLFDTQKFTIYKNECVNEPAPCKILMSIYNKTTYQCDHYYAEVNETQIISLTQEKQVCEKKEVNELIYVDERCVSHGYTPEQALFNCVTFVKNDKYLNEGWLYSHCLCETEGVTIKPNYYGEKECKSWKCGEFEVSLK